MAVTLSLFAGAGAQFFTDSGSVLTGGKIYSYAAGTTTPETTYTTSAGNVAHTNPIVLNAAGRVASGGEIWLTNNVIYKFLLKDSNDVLIATYDNISNSSDASFIQYTPDANSLLAPGPLTVKSALDQITDEDSGSSVVGFLQSGTGAVATTAQAKLREFVSVKDFGAVGDGVTDDTVALQAAVNYCAATSKSLYVPPGTYIISARVFQQTNGARITIFGAGYNSSILKAASTLTNTEMLYFGNSNGHGVYGLFLRDIGLDGGGVANNVTGIAAIENGLSHFENLRISNCGLGARCDGSIHMIWDGHNEVRNCNFGISFLRIPRGTPSNSFDYTVTLGPLAMSTNVSSIKNTWMNGCTNGAIVMEGGLVAVENCVFQSTVDNANASVVVFQDANESYDYGGGPRFINNWTEGGNYKYWVEINNSRNAVLQNNFFSGSTNQQGGFLLRDNAANAIIEGNSFRGGITATTTEGRYQNAAVYYDIDGAIQFPFSFRDNYVTTNIANLRLVLANTAISGTDTSWRYSFYENGNNMEPVVYSTTGELLAYPDKNVHAHGTVGYTSEGSGFVTGDTVSLAGANGLGTGATGTVTASAGAITAIAITASGTGYSNNQMVVVTATSGSGIGARCLITTTTGTVATAVISTGTPSLIYGSNIISITDGGTGFLIVSYSRNKVATFQPFDASASDSAGSAFMIGTIRFGTGGDRIKVYNSSAALTDPESISFVCYGGTQ